MNTALRRAPIWLVVLTTALLSAVVTLGLDRSITALQVEPTPTVVGVVPPVIVQMPTIAPTLPAVSGSRDEQERELEQLREQSDQYLGMMFVLKAEREISLGLEALAMNNVARSDRVLVAAKTSLDEAFQLVSEDIKPQIDRERLEIGRIRFDLDVNPRDLDEDLRQMRDRLLSMVALRSQ